MSAFTRPSTSAMIASGSVGRSTDTPGTSCVATHTAIATTTRWRGSSGNPPLFVSPASRAVRPSLAEVPASPAYRRSSRSIASCHRVSMTRRRTFSVGVSSPPAIVNSAGSSAICLTCSYCARSRLSASTISWYSPRTSARPTSASRSPAGSAQRLQPLARARRTPARSARPGTGGRRRPPPPRRRAGAACSRASIGCGATFLPPEVTSRSFLRSVIVRIAVGARARRCRRCGTSRRAITAAVSAGRFQ